jgi:hypothetical protein
LCFLFALSAWLSGYENPVVSRINMRIQDLTGLDVSTAEELQVGDHIILTLFFYTSSKDVSGEISRHRIGSP